MTVMLDSARLADAERAAALSFVRGATTNPALLAQAAQAEPGRAANAAERLAALCDRLPGPIFYQLSAPTLAEREAEAETWLGLRPGRIGLKVPCTPENLGLAARCARAGATVGLTTIFSAAQAALAAEAGAHFIFPYVNRSTRLLGDGLALVREMRAVLDALGAPTQIAAASIKTPAEAVATLLAGAHHLTLPLAVIEAMGQHPLSDQTIAEFAGRPPA